MRHRVAAVVTTRPVLTGFLGGIGAFLSVVAVTTAVSLHRLRVLNDPVRDVGTLTDTLFPPVWKAVGWTVLGSHGVRVRPVESGRGGDALAKLLFWLYSGVDFPTRFPLTVSPSEGAVQNLVLVAFTDLQVGVLVLTPVVALVLVGALVARQFATGYWDGAVLGAIPVFGYLPCVLVSALLTRATITAYGYEATLGVDPASAAALAGIVYPVLFGGLGGVLSRGGFAVLRRQVSRIVRDHVLLDSR